MMMEDELEYLPGASEKLMETVVKVHLTLCLTSARASQEPNREPWQCACRH